MNSRLRKLRRLFLRRAERARRRGAGEVAHINRRKANFILRKIRHNRRVRTRKPQQHGLVWMDGRKVAAWIAADLQKIRAAGRWRGYVVSGWRDPVYSERLCLQMCGRPSCPGRCAGRASRHSGIEYPNGAADVSDFYVAANESRRLGLRLRNDLPNDRVHLSSDGH